MSVHEKRLRELTAESDFLRTKQAKLFNEINKVQYRIKNKFYQSLFEHIPIDGPINLCHEYANLGFCVMHNTYFPLTISKCIECCNKKIDKHTKSKDDWLWYTLYHTCTKNNGFYTLDEMEDLIFLANVRTLKCKFELRFISEHWTSCKNLKLGISRHFKYDQFLIIIVSDDNEFNNCDMLSYNSEAFNKFDGKVFLHKEIWY